MHIGIDIGGTNTRIAAFPNLQSTEFELLDNFITHAQYGQQIDKIISSIKRRKIKRLQGIGISIGAQVAKDGGSVLDSSNIPDYVGKPIVKQLSDLFNCKVRLAHDCICGVLAEKQFGGIKNVDRAAYITVSTGTGAAIFIKKGKLEMIFSIEMGHQILNPQGYKCLCGQTGCLETITGGKQIELRHKKKASEITGEKFWAEFTESLAIGIVNLSWLTRVDAVVVSGGIALNSQYVRSNLQNRVDQLRVGEEGAIFPVYFSSLGENPPLIGSALLPDMNDAGILH